MVEKNHTRTNVAQYRPIAEVVGEHNGYASFAPPEGVNFSGVGQMYSRWTENEQRIIQQNRPQISLVDDALMQVYYHGSKSGQAMEKILEMNSLLQNFDKQLKLRGILNKITQEAPEGELQNVSSEAYTQLQTIITKDESKLKNENDYLHGYRKKQLSKGEDISTDAEKKEEVAQQLESLFPNGIMVCFSIPDAYLSKADAKSKIKKKEDGTRYARGQSDDLEKIQKISYTNEAEFLNSAFPYAKNHNAVGLYGNKLKLGIPTIYTSPEEIGIKAKSIQQQLAGILGHDHPCTKIKYLAIFTHGSVENMAGRKVKNQKLPTQNTKIKKDNLPNLVQSLPLTDDVSVRLFACNTGRTKGVAKDEDAAGTGKDGFSDAFRDELMNQGYEDASVIGHIVAGHTIRNRQQRLFIGEGDTSFNIQVSEKILEANLPDNYKEQIKSELLPNKEEQKGILASMIWLYQNESWLIDLPPIPEPKEGEESLDEAAQSEFRKNMFANFFDYWIARVKENRHILNKAYQEKKKKKKK